VALEAWLPVGFALPGGAIVHVALFEGLDWQIYETAGGGRALVARDALAQRWLDSGLIDEGTLDGVRFGDRRLLSISVAPSQILCPVSEAESPNSKSEALAFALALKATRDIDAESALQDALYVEKITRLLPTYSISSRTSDDVVLGYWLTGGASIPATSFRRLRQTMSWLGANHLKDVVQAAGFEVAEVIPSGRESETPAEKAAVVRPEEGRAKHAADAPSAVFELAGRPNLAAFFNEHIVDIVLHRERYKALGIGFPSAVVLHGPPGCGKTFAVERLVDFLGWPSFQIDAASVASPYIHETSKKIAQVFEKAMDNAPSVLVIDEMEAFLADRETGSGHHRVEEVAEFLRRIPEAAKNDVLIVAMTNRIDMIDAAILRRGRFDHIVSVDLASAEEVRALLEKLLSEIPTADDVDTRRLAATLERRPLSDVAFVIREGARLAARAGLERLDQQSLLAAMKAADARHRDAGASRRIGFA
jgi:AAA+ superfamily predicted ATPase